MRMTLSTEDLGDIPNVNAATLDEVLEPDGFGKFAIEQSQSRPYPKAGRNVPRELP